VTLTYGVVTPARDEEEHLRGLAACLAAQTLPPAHWVVVDDGSADATADVAARHGATVVRLHARTAARGGPVVRALTAGLGALDDVDVVIKVDADVTFAPDYLAQLVAAFAADPQLGMASGSCWEEEGGSLRQRFGAGMGVWGATRAYRRECLRDVLPLEERQGWDEIDAARANAHGWRTRTLLDLPFVHHRSEGTRDGSRAAVWRAQGDVAHYMGYRWSYVLARTAFRAAREPSALAILVGYADAALRRAPRLEDEAAVRHVREHQRLRRLPHRALDVIRPRAGARPRARAG
jgi:biofilm PGA synthesis N-glycosyltransferase PgaC